MDKDFKGVWIPEQILSSDDLSTTEKVVLSIANGLADRDSGCFANNEYFACEFGNNDPITIDEKGVIIEDHGRYIALKELGYKQIEVIKLGHLSDEQKRAYALIHNKITIDTGFNLEILETQLSEIVEIDMNDFNFSDMQFLRIDSDYDEEEKSAKTHSLYLQYKNKKIHVSSQEEIFWTV